MDFISKAILLTIAAKHSFCAGHGMGNMGQGMPFPFPPVMPPPVVPPFQLPYGLQFLPSNPMIPIAGPPPPPPVFPPGPVGMYQSNPLQRQGQPSSPLSGNGPVSIYPYANAYSSMLKRQKNKKMRKRLRRFMNDHDDYPRRRRYRKHRKHRQYEFGSSFEK